MSAIFARRWLGSVCSLAWVVVGSIAAAQECREFPRPIDREFAEYGQQLFAHRWTPQDALSPQGDGLGPMYNADSCVACHFQGGAGGAGPAKFNVQLMTVSSTKGGSLNRTRSASGQRDLVSRLDSANSNFIGDARNPNPQITAVFHRFGPDDQYEDWRESFWGVPLTLQGPERYRMLYEAHQVRDGQRVIELDRSDLGLRFHLSERNTPSLFGAEEIDQILDEQIRALSNRQRLEHPEICGRAVELARFEGRKIAAREIGHFGWRGQTSRLRDFVVGACAVELGLSTKEQLQPRDARLPSAESALSPLEDMSAEQCAQLVEYVRCLPRPKEAKPTSFEQLNRVIAGEGLFAEVGCAICHVPNVGKVKGLYSDLLLHTMGDALADPAPSPSKNPASAAYYGDSPLRTGIPLAWSSEFRTPPLWGVADSAPYLHDGRAETLKEAILLHGGQAESAVSKFKLLAETQRANLLEFLGSLRAPDAADQRARLQRKSVLPIVE